MICNLMSDNNGTITKWESELMQKLFQIKVIDTSPVTNL